MGLMSRARVLGFRGAYTSGGQYYVYLPAHRRQVLRRRVVVGRYTARHNSVSQGPLEGRYAAQDAMMGQLFPALTEFLTESVDEDGRPRVTSTLLISCEDGMWKLALTDRAQANSKFDFKLWISGATLQEAAGALDACLADGSAQWRKFPKWQPKGGR